MHRIAALFSLMLLAPTVGAQSPAAGRLLLATPALTDQSFTSTVILVVHNSEEGSFGLFLNRPTWVDGAAGFAELESLDEATRTLDFGGPVAMTQLLALVGGPAPGDGATRILDGVFLTADIAAAAGSADIRIFAGHAVWGPDQLEQEVDDGFWRVVEGSAELIFDVSPEALLERVVELAASGMTAALPQR
jgi:putative transcriptional regulator